jgi:hypothetical protein
METNKYRCNNCNRTYHSLEGVIDCICKFKKVKWNNPTSRSKERLWQYGN